MQWYYARNRQQSGPVEEDELRRLAREGGLAPNDLVWNASMGSQWAEARTVPGLFGEEGGPVLPPGAGAPAPAPAPAVAGTGGDTPNAELAARARAALSGRWGLAAGFTFVYFLVVFLGSLVSSILPLGQLVFQLLTTGPLMVGSCLFFFALIRNGEPAIGQMFAGFRRFGPAVGVYVLVSLYLFLWMLLALAVLGGVGFALFGRTLVALFRQAAEGGAPPALGGMAAGLVAYAVFAYLVALAVSTVVWLRYALAFFVVADRPGVGAAGAVRQSVEMTRGRKGKLFLLFLRFLGWGILATLPCGLGWLWLWPYIAASWACFYDDLSPAA